MPDPVNGYARRRVDELDELDERRVRAQPVDLAFQLREAAV
jgi:hypothetical protein